MAAKLCTLLLAAVVVLSLLVSPIACSSRKLTKSKPKTKPISHRQAAPAARTIHKPAAAAPAVKVSHKPATAAKSHTNHTATPSSPSTVYGSGGWLSGAGATYYGAPNGDGGEG